MDHMHNCCGSSLLVPHAYRQGHCSISVLPCEWVGPYLEQAAEVFCGRSTKGMFWDLITKTLCNKLPPISSSGREVIIYFFLGDTACLPPYCLHPFLAFGHRGARFYPYICLLFLEFFCLSVVVYKCWVPVLTNIASSCSLLTSLTPVPLPW